MHYFQHVQCVQFSVALHHAPLFTCTTFAIFTIHLHVQHVLSLCIYKCIIREFYVLYIFEIV